MKKLTLAIVTLLFSLNGNAIIYEFSTGDDYSQIHSSSIGFNIRIDTGDDNVVDSVTGEVFDPIRRPQLEQVIKVVPIGSWFPQQPGRYNDNIITGDPFKFFSENGVAFSTSSFSYVLYDWSRRPTNQLNITQFQNIIIFGNEVYGFNRYLTIGGITLNQVNPNVVSQVPEPNAFILFILGLLTLSAFLKFKYKF